MAQSGSTPEYRTHLCQRWLADACTHMRRQLQMATQVRQAIAAGLTREEAQLSVEATSADVRRLEQTLVELRAEAKKADIELPIEVLVAQGKLDALDRAMLILAVAPHVDVEIRDAIARFNDNLLANYVDVRLCLEFLTNDPVERLAMRSRFSSGGHLLQARMVGLDRPRDSVGDNLLSYEISPAPRVMQLLLGEVGLLDSAMEDMARFERPTVTL